MVFIGMVVSHTIHDGNDFTMIYVVIGLDGTDSLVSRPNGVVAGVTSKVGHFVPK